MINIDQLIDLETENDGKHALLDDFTEVFVDAKLRRISWSCYTQCITITFKPDVVKNCMTKNTRLYNYFRGRCDKYCRNKKVKLYLVPDLHESGVLHFHGYIVCGNNDILKARFLAWLRRNFGFVLCEPKRTNWDYYIWSDYEDFVVAYNNKMKYLTIS